MESKVDQAVDYFKSGLSCSQAMLLAYGPEYGIDKTLALKISTPFSGGMARMSQTCGAVTGAFIILGLKYAVSKEAKEKLFALENDFSQKFKLRNKSINCKELLGYDLGNPEERKEFADKKLSQTLCQKFVKDASEILEEIIAAN